MGMAMFKRTFARTLLDNLRAPHMKMWGFEAKRARKFTRTSPRTLPWNFITMLSAPLKRGGHINLLSRGGFKTYPPPPPLKNALWGREGGVVVVVCIYIYIDTHAAGSISGPHLGGFRVNKLSTL